MHIFLDLSKQFHLNIRAPRCISHITHQDPDLMPLRQNVQTSPVGALIFKFTTCFLPVFFPFRWNMHWLMSNAYHCPWEPQGSGGGSSCLAPVGTVPRSGMLGIAGLHHSSEFSLCLDWFQTTQNTFGFFFFFPCIKTVLRSVQCALQRMTARCFTSVLHFTSYLISSISAHTSWSSAIKQKGPILQRQRSLSGRNLMSPLKNWWWGRHMRGSLWENWGAYCKTRIAGNMVKDCSTFSLHLRQ